jgi:hypothetical protein
MKKASQLIAANLAAAISIWCSPAIAGEWVRLETSRNGTTVYLDKASIERKGQERYFWLFASSPTPLVIHQGKKAYNVGIYLSMDCESKRVYGPHFMRLMNRDNQPIADRSLQDGSDRLLPYKTKEKKAIANIICR